MGVQGKNDLIHLYFDLPNYLLAIGFVHFKNSFVPTFPQVIDRGCEGKVPPAALPRCAAIPLQQML